MSVALKFLLSKIVHKGSLTVHLADGEQLHFGDQTGPHLEITLKDKHAETELFLHPEMALGELYTDGRLTVGGGSIYDILDLVGRNLSNLTVPQFSRLRKAVRGLLSVFERRNSKTRSKRNVEYHYDIDDRIYSLFLDQDRQYSCAYFESEDQSLDDAQEAKKRHISAKLKIQPGQRVLDIGSGWGGLAMYIGRHFGADVVGLTLSEEQLKVSSKRASADGLSKIVKFRLQDFRNVDEKFDRIVSVGMFEHVGKKEYPTFFDVVRRSLKENGIVLLHTIGRLDGKSTTNPWFAKYIFPGSYVPALSEILPIIEKSGLIVTDIEILRLHYARTLSHWRSRFMAHRAEAAAILGERFCRMWEYYLAASEAGFRYGGLVVFQVQLAGRLETVPRTRRYILEEETRLRHEDEVIRGVAAE